MRASGRTGTHISGAEGLFPDEKEAQRAATEYLGRALGHPRGRPEHVSITVEKLRKKPKPIRVLPVCTLVCSSPSHARAVSRDLLETLGLSEEAIEAAFDVAYGPRAMRGGALIDAESGRRLEPDPARGVRASMMGIQKNTESSLGRHLSRFGINTPVVKEALVLASKVASARDIIAEFCVPDNPGYTTGYIASRKFGYLRLPNVKKQGSRRGGRIFFVPNGADVERIIAYLEDTPVLVTGLSEVRGEILPDELIGRHRR